MKKQLRTSQVNLDLRRLRFLKSSLKKNDNRNRQQSIIAHLSRVLSRLRGVVQLLTIKKVLGTSFVGLLSLATHQLHGQTLSEPILIEHTFEEFPIAPDLADIDGDGDLDLITSIFSGDDFIETGYMENIGNSKEFILADSLQLLPITHTMEEVGVVPEMADLDNDGDLDYCSFSYGDYYETILLYAENLGNGAFGPVTNDTILKSNEVVWGSYDGNLIDLDDDGDLDIMTVGYDIQAYYAGNNKLGVGYTENIGTADSAVWGEMKLIEGFPEIANEEEALTQVELADFDLDGDLDLLVTNYENYDDEFYQLSYVENLGASYAEAKLIELFDLQEGFIPMTSGDIDGDGDVDVLFNTSNFPYVPELYWLENLETSSNKLTTLQNAKFSLAASLVHQQVLLDYEVEQRADLELSIINSLGQVVKQQMLKTNSVKGSTQLNVSQLPIGNYFLRVATQEGQAVLKFSKF